MVVVPLTLMTQMCIQCEFPVQLSALVKLSRLHLLCATYNDAAISARSVSHPNQQQRRIFLIQANHGFREQRSASKGDERVCQRRGLRNGRPRLWVIGFGSGSRMSTDNTHLPSGTLGSRRLMIRTIRSFVSPSIFLN